MTGIAALRQRILHKVAEIRRFHAQHGSRNGWTTPCDASILEDAKRTVFREAALVELTRAMVGDPIRPRVVKVVLAAYERGLLNGFAERDANTLRGALHI